MNMNIDWEQNKIDNDLQGALREDPVNSGISGDTAESENVPVKEMDILSSVPPEQQRWDLFDEIAVFGVSLRGRSHVKSGLPCQDSNDFLYLHQEKILIAAIADGVGSCSFSHWGAHTAVQEAINSIRDSIVQIANGHPVKISDLSQVQIEEVFNKAFLHAQNKVEEFADHYQQSVVHFQSTLTVALYDGNRVVCCHIGDDGIVAQGTSGKYQMITKRIKGEEANSVFTLQSGKWYITTISTDITGFMMSTDGILDFYVTNEGMGNRVYYPFLHTFLYGMKPTSGQDLRSVVENTMQSTIAFLNSDERVASVMDDMTILAIANQRHLCEATVPTFSQSEWEDEQKRIRKEQLKKLNASKTVIPPLKQRTVTQPKSKEKTTADTNNRQSYHFDETQGKKQPPYVNHRKATLHAASVPAAGSTYNGHYQPSNGKKAKSTYETSQNPYYLPQYGSNISSANGRLNHSDAYPDTYEEESIGFFDMIGEGIAGIGEGIMGGINKAASIMDAREVRKEGRKYRCCYCGRSISKRDKYCKFCNYPFTWRCGNCGNPIRNDEKKCSRCGCTIGWR